MSGSEISRKYSTQDAGTREEIFDFLKYSESSAVNPDDLFAHTWQLNGSNEQVAGMKGQINAKSASSVAAFNTWKTRRDAVNNEHSEYLKLVQQRPGRQGTILVQPEGSKAGKTLLG